MTATTPDMSGVLAAFAELRIESIRIFNALASEHGLAPTDYSALYFIAGLAGATPTQVADYVGLTTGSITTLIDRLERRKLVKRAPNASDRRSIVVVATAKGQAAVANARDAYAEAFGAALHSEDPERVVRMFDTLAQQLHRVGLREQQAS